MAKRKSFIEKSRRSFAFNKTISDSIESFNEENEEKINIEQYLELLKTENKEWENIYNSKKKCLRDIRKQNDLPTITEDALQYLDEEKKKFLFDKPNYNEMLETVKQYNHAVVFLEKYKSDLIKCYDETTEVMEKQMKKLKAKLCSDKLCELCREENCKHCHFDDM